MSKIRKRTTAAHRRKATEKGNGWKNVPVRAKMRANRV
jgi:hypothetical protein